MPLRHLLRQLLNNEQVIQKIADFPPIRKAARITVSIFHKGKEKGLEQMEHAKGKATEGGDKLSSFSERVKKEIAKEYEKEMKKKR